MDPKMQSSFIPKTPIATDRGVRSSNTVNLFFLISVLIFITSLAIGGFLFFYNANQQKQIDAIVSSLATAEKDFSGPDVNVWTELDKRTQAAQEVLDRHYAVSSLFRLLQELTVKNIRFTRFDFALKEAAAEGTSLALALSGEGRSYNAVSYQSDVMKVSESLKDVLFSDIRLDEKGNILFSVKATVDPNLTSYKKLFTAQ